MLFKVFFQRLKSVISVTINDGFLYRSESYSQEGEDLVLNKLLPQSKGYYIDIGAHHPYRYSNTYLFYKRGWRGINVDPNPEAIELFNLARPKDINIKAAIGREKKKRVFYIFQDSALNTFSKDNAEQVIDSRQSVLIKQIAIRTLGLTDVLRKHLINRQIDFLNIDVEGLEIEVLQSIDWKIYKPKVIALELVTDISIDKIVDKTEVRLLIKKGYCLRARTINTLIFQLKE